MNKAAAQFNQLQKILSEVSAKDKYQSDQAAFGSHDHWRIPGIDDTFDIGDCEDWSMKYAWLLVKVKGWQNRKVQLALCQLKGGQDHMVTIVSTDNGHFVLDCRQAFPLPPRHRYLKIKKWYAASPLFVADWHELIAPGGPLPAAMKDGAPNSEHLISGRPCRPHPKHLAWLQKYQERNVT